MYWTFKTKCVMIKSLESKNVYEVANVYFYKISSEK